MLSVITHIVVLLNKKTGFALTLDRMNNAINKATISPKRILSDNLAIFTPLLCFIFYLFRKTSKRCFSS